MSNQTGDLEAKCKGTIEHFKKELGKLRTGRAQTSLLDGIHADYYGSQVPLIQLAMINTPEPRLIALQVYDGGAVDAVEKAIKHADLGLNPQRDGNTIRLSIPALTEERRKEFIKKLHKMAEENRVTIRNHRRDSIDVLKKSQKDGKISEDDLRKGQEGIQKVTDKYIAEVDALLVSKEKEMMEV